MHPDWYYDLYEVVFGRLRDYEYELSVINQLHPLLDRDVQEIGAGTGNHAQLIYSRQPRSIELVDEDARAIELLRERFTGRPSVRITEGDGFREWDHEVDIVVCMFCVVMKVQSFDLLLQRLKSVFARLRECGRFCFEFIDAEVSEGVYPPGKRSRIDIGEEGELFISSSYGDHMNSVHYRGRIRGRSIQYDARMLSVTLESMREAIKLAGGVVENVVALDKFGRRNIICASMAAKDT